MFITWTAYISWVPGNFLTFVKGQGLGQYDGAGQCDQQGLLVLPDPRDQLILNQVKWTEMFKTTVAWSWFLVLGQTPTKPKDKFNHKFQVS